MQLQKDHRVVILQTMDNVAKESLDQIPLHHALDLIKLASDELTATKVGQLDFMVNSLRSI